MGGSQIEFPSFYINDPYQIQLPLEERQDVNAPYGKQILTTLIQSIN